MKLFPILLLVSIAALPVGSDASPQLVAEQPSISYGLAGISLGMTLSQVEKILSVADRRLQSFNVTELHDVKVESYSVYPGDGDGQSEGQITFLAGRVAYAKYQMPNVRSAYELAQEIAGAVDTLKTKTCSVLNYSSHGTGGGFSQSIFECGSKTFDVMTAQALSGETLGVTVNIEIGQFPH